MRRSNDEFDSKQISPDSSSNRDLHWVFSVMGGRCGFFLAILFAILATAFAGYRAQQKYSQPSREAFDFSMTGMSDFHNGTYYPSIAFRHGVNPYAKSVCESYPMARSAPVYSPFVFMLYSPFSYLPLPAADVAFFAFNVLLMAGLAWFCVAMIRGTISRQNWPFVESGRGCLNCFGSDITAAIWLFGWMMFSRPGHITLFTGYFTLQLILGTVLAVHFGNRRPWISAIGMLLTSGKPTYIIPLTILMLAKRQFRSVFYGLVLCTIFGAAGVAWLASFSDLPTVIEGIQEGQAEFDKDPTELPSFIWTRLDLMGVIAKLADWTPTSKVYLVAMFVLLMPVCVLLWRRSGSHGHSSQDNELGLESGVGWSACIAYLALLISIYHHSYDGLLASVVWAAVLFGGNACLQGMKTGLQRILLVLLTVPAINYVATLSFRDKFQIANDGFLWKAIASVNGLCLLVALVLLLAASTKVGIGIRGRVASNGETGQAN